MITQAAATIQVGHGDRCFVSLHAMVVDEFSCHARARLRVGIDLTGQKPRNVRMYRSRFAWSACVFVSGTLLLQGCNGVSVPTPFAGEPRAVYKEIPIERGSVTSEIQSSGLATAPIQSPLSMRASGVIKEIKVKPGDTVQVGQELIVLDVPELEAQVIVAQAGIESAQARYDQAQVGPKAEDIGIAQAQVDVAAAKLSAVNNQGRVEDINSAQAQVEAARARLNGVLAGGKPEVVAQAEQAVKIAQSKVDAIQAGGKPETIAQAQEQVKIAQYKVDAILAGGKPETIAQAQEQVKVAQAKVDTILAGGKPEAINQAQEQVKVAQSKVDALKAGPNPATVAQAQAKLDQAKAQLAQMQAGPKPEQVDVYKKGVEKAKNDLWAAQIGRDAAAGKPNAAQYQIDQGNAQVAAAQTALDQAEKQLQLQLAPPTATDLAAQKAVITQAEAALQAAQNPNTPQDLQQAQAQLAQAQSALQAAKSPYTQQDLDQAKAQLAQAQSAAQAARSPNTPQDLDQAKAQLGQAQAALQAARSPYTKQDLDQARAQVTQAQAALAQTRQPNSPQDIEAARAAVTQAQENLAKVIRPYQPEDIAQASAVVDQAQQGLEAKKHPYTAQDLAVLKAAINQAKAQLAVAQANLSQTILKAPFTGIVQQVNVVPGQLVTSGIGASASTLSTTPPIVLASGDLVVQASIDETDITKVKVGEPVTYLFDGVPDVRFTGKVDTVPPVGTLVQGVVSYGILGTLDPGQVTTSIRPGMTGTLHIQVGKKDGVLVVPYQAVQIMSGRASVNVPNPGNPTHPFTRFVKLGLTDGTRVEVVDGLKEGDKVLQFGRRIDMAAQESPSTAGASTGKLAGK